MKIPDHVVERWHANAQAQIEDWREADRKAASKDRRDIIITIIAALAAAGALPNALSIFV
ncbi:MAG: hypothetical protein CL949_20505 [Erythrobacter sp.]|nr:hypothetical protein [Erythrobacter sp.]